MEKYVNLIIIAVLAGVIIWRLARHEVSIRRLEMRADNMYNAQNLQGDRLAELEAREARR